MTSEDTTPVPARGAPPGETTELDAESVRAAASEPREREPVLIVVGGPHAGTTIPVRAVELVIGRDAACDVPLPASGLSRRHLRIKRQRDGAVAVMDLGSKNGVYVNGKPVGRAVLRHGDHVHLGRDTLMRFTLEDPAVTDACLRKHEEAIRDDLTGAYNRRHLEAVLAHEIAYATRHRSGLGLLLLDLDHFKRVNDRYGHRAGDTVLRRCADAMRGHLRAEDLFARFGGEEFAVVLRGADRAQALESAERLRRLLGSLRFRVDGEDVRVTVSIGAATLDGDGPRDADALIDEADARLYQAKGAGRDRSVG